MTLRATGNRDRANRHESGEDGDAWSSVSLEVPVPAVPVSLFEPIWAQFAALLPTRPIVVPTHPLGRHRTRIADRVVFEHVVAALVHGSGYERIASSGCSDRTIRRRVHEWAEAGLTERLHTLVLTQYDRMIGLDLDTIVVDGCITKAPSGGEKAGRSPVDRGKLGLKRSTLTEANGIPLHVVSAGANRHDAPLLAPTLAGLTAFGPLTPTPTLHLDCGYRGSSIRCLLETLGIAGEIAQKGIPAPLQLGRRWVVERTQSWMNGFGKLQRCTERTGIVVDFYLFLAATFVTTRRLINEARTSYRWPSRPATRRLP
jgi:transposase